MADHLYIHVPFCARRCSYCDFSIAVRPTTPIDEYLAALRTELALTRAVDDARLETVYLGGGTPSRLGGAGVAAVISAVRERSQIAPNAEITIEANPDDVTKAAVLSWATAGVNRVSLGAQSFDDSVLRWMHRTHDAAQIARAVATLRSAGLANISLDLIFSLPAHLDRSWEKDIDRALELAPQHVSLYGLTVETHTPIARWKERGAVVEGTEDRYEEEFLYAHHRMTGAGFDHYEVSNFGRPSLHSCHNSAYWTGVPYAAIGPSAHSFDGAVRRWNVSAYSEWIRCLAAGQTPVAGEETLTSEDREAEAIYLGLRTAKGLEIRDHELALAQTWAEAGWARISQPAHLTLTPLGWLRLDSIAAELASRRARPSSVLGANPSHCYI